MAKLTKEDVQSIAWDVVTLVNPRVIMRKMTDGTVQFVVYHGPNDARSEIVFDRSVDRSTIKAKLEQ